MLGFVPTAAQNQQLRREHSDRLSRTRRENLEHMQRLMAAAAQSGMEITPEWLASQESAMMTPELMAMGISPREAVTQKMIESSNKQAERARLAQELEQLKQKEEADSMFANYITGQLHAGKTEAEIGAGLMQQFPLLGKEIEGRLPNIINQSRSRMAAQIMQDPRLRVMVDTDNIPDDLRFAGTDDSLRAIILDNRERVADLVASDVFSRIKGTTDPVNYAKLAGDVRQGLKNRGIEASEDYVSQIVDRVVGNYNSDNATHVRSMESATVQTFAAGAVRQEERDAEHAREQEILARQEKMQTQMVFQRQVEELGTVPAFENPKGRVAEAYGDLKGYLSQFEITGQAYTQLVGVAQRGGDVNAAFKQIMGNPELKQNVRTAQEVMVEAEIRYDANSGRYSQEEFVSRWTQFFDADLRRFMDEFESRHPRQQNQEELRNVISGYQASVDTVQRLAAGMRSPHQTNALGIFQQSPRGLNPQGITAGRQPIHSSRDTSPESLVMYPEEAVAHLPAPAQEFLPIIASSAQRYGVPVSWLMALAERESGFRADAQNAGGDSGLFQYSPDTVKDRGIRDPFDPAEASEHAARDFARRLETAYKATGSVEAALEEAIRAHQAGDGGAPFGPTPGRARGPNNDAHFRAIVEIQRKYAHLDAVQPQMQGTPRPEVAARQTPLDRAMAIAGAGHQQEDVSVTATKEDAAESQPQESWIRDSRGNIQLLQPGARAARWGRGIMDQAAEEGRRVEEMRLQQGF